ncbi:MAG: DUF3658 domain-containing protein [Nitrobacter sp.]
MQLSDIDKQILAHAKSDWRKIAFMVAAVGEFRGIDCEIIASRIGALVGDGKLESQGDINDWRFSEVRLPTQR